MVFFLLQSHKRERELEKKIDEIGKLYEEVCMHCAMS